ncbi:hypothetical protein HK098_002555 [Nowakowskiella sp. JEL0407]|nr:hypothetical protein HK098_002555 [Nowakowskiella sp. JEL0407]
MKQYSSLIFTLLFCLYSLASAQVPTPNDVNQSIVKTLTISSGIAGGIYALVGLLFVFFGYKLFRFVLFAIGFYIGSALSYIVLLNVQPAGGFSEWVYFAVSIGVGILFGFLFICFYKLGIAGLGAFGGFTLAVWILSFKAGGVIQSEVGRIIFIIILVIVGLVVALFVEKPAIIVTTSIVGSVSTLIGIDVFAQTGVSRIIISFVQSSGKVGNLGDSISTTQYVILGAMGLLAVIGIVVQFYTTRGQHDTHKSAGYRYRRAKPETAA